MLSKNHLLRPLSINQRKAIDELNDRLILDNIPGYKNLDIRLIEKVAAFVATRSSEYISRQYSRPEALSEPYNSSLGLSCAQDLRRTFLFALLTASAIYQLRQKIPHNQRIEMAELGSGSGGNCLVALLLDNNIRVFAFEKNPTAIAFSRDLVSEFGYGDPSFRIIEGDFIENLKSQELPNFDLFVNENIHFSNFAEPFFEAAIAARNKASSNAIMVPDGLVVRFSTEYYGPTSFLANLKMLNLPEDLTFWINESLPYQSSLAAALYPPEQQPKIYDSALEIDSSGHLFFDFLSGGKAIFSTTKRPSFSAMVINAMGNILNAKCGHAFAKNLPDKPTNGCTSYLRILLEKDVRVGSYLSPYAEPYIFRKFNQTLFKVF